MGLNLADFVTGRSIAESDAIVALVIIPAEGGYPDAVRSAAAPPVYPHDRFEPISLPLHGRMNDRGYFSPDPQLALDIFLATAGVSTWEEFETRALNEKDEPFEFSHPNKKMVDLLGIRRSVVPGLSLMHRSTFESLRGFAGHRDPAEIDLATEICLEAQRRFARTNDLASFGLAALHGSPARPYRLADGRDVAVPWVMAVLQAGSGTELSNFAVTTIQISNERAHLTDGAKLRETFASLMDFQRVAAGLQAINRYWAPSAFTRRDNLLTVAQLQIRDLQAAMTGVSDRLNLGPDWRDEPSPDLQHLAGTLRGLLDTVEAEIALHSEPTPAP